MFSTRSIITSSALVCSLLTGLAQAEDGLASGADRILFGSTVQPSIDGGLELEIVWTAFLTAPALTTLDLSTDIFVEAGNLAYTVHPVRVIADAGAGFNPNGTFGGFCGTGSVDNVDVELIDLSENGDHCQFPWIKTSFTIPAEMFDENDVIKVRILPSAGSVPDIDTSNNSTVEPVGGSKFYDRSFDSVNLVPVPGTQDVFDIVVEYRLAYNTAMPPEDLRTDIVMNHNGETFVFQPWCGPWLTTPFSNCGDCSGQTCAVIKCGGETVATLSCQPYENDWGQFGCACVSKPIQVTIPSVQLKDGDSLELSLTHAPGAMPELSGLDEDSWTVCSNEAQSSTYGQGKAGTLGVPTLDSIAPPVLGQVSGIRMKEALPGAMPVLFLGVAPLNVPFGGGQLLVDPAQMLFLPTPVGADGTLALQSLLPADPSLCGASLYYQMMFMDSGAAGPKHIAMTNGLNQVFGW